MSKARLPQQYPANATDRLDQLFVNHRWLGPTLLVIVGLACALVSFGIDRTQLPRWEALALVLAALMMAWAAWGSRALVMSSRDELRELQLQRHATMTPVVSMEWPLMAPNYKGVTHLKVANIGLGPAMNLRIAFNDESVTPLAKGMRRMTPPSLAPRAEAEVDYQQSVDQPFDAKTVEVIATYNDVFGNRYESRLTTSDEKEAWLDWLQAT